MYEVIPVDGGEEAVCLDLILKMQERKKAQIGYLLNDHKKKTRKALEERKPPPSS